MLLSIACSATQKIAPTFIPPTASPYPSETPLPSPTTTPIPNATELTAHMAPPTPTSGSLGATAPGAGCIPNNEMKEMYVTGVLSGDTIIVDIDKNNIELLYIGMTAPNPTGETGQASKIYNDERVDSKTITVIHDQDPINGFGQLEAYVIADGLFVNYEMVRRGFARAIASKTNPSCNETLHKAEEEAQSEQTGLWNVTINSPTAPPQQITPTP